MKNRRIWKAAGVASILLFSASAEIIYDNSTNFTESFNDSLLETGDEVLLAGSDRLVTSFAFEYFAEFAPSGDETARLRFYRMDGAAGQNEFETPGTLLYDSGAFSISSGYHSVDVTELSVLLPSDRFTWSVQFSGLAATESAGLLFYDPPTVGSSDDYFWENENGAWLAVASDGTGNNFAAQVIATNAATTIQISSIRYENGVATLIASGATAGKTYSLEYKNSVTAGSWTQVPGTVTAAGDTTTIADPTAQGAPYRFYRIAQLN